jgi:antirestriction protein
MTTIEIPRIYVASLSDYNDGRLHGRWIDANQDIEDVWAEINEMLAESPINHDPKLAWALPVEEWAIHDHECFLGINIGEYASIESVVALANALVESNEPEALAAWIQYQDDWDAAIESFDDHYRGDWQSLGDYAQEFAADTAASHEMAKWIEEWSPYIDWKYWARSNLDMIEIEIDSHHYLFDY